MDHPWIHPFVTNESSLSNDFSENSDQSQSTNGQSVLEPPQKTQGQLMNELFAEHPELKEVMIQKRMEKAKKRMEWWIIDFDEVVRYFDEINIKIRSEEEIWEVYERILGGPSVTINEPLPLHKEKDEQESQVMESTISTLATCEPDPNNFNTCCSC